MRSLSTTITALAITLPDGSIAFPARIAFVAVNPGAAISANASAARPQPDRT